MTLFSVPKLAIASLLEKNATDLNLGISLSFIIVLKKYRCVHFTLINTCLLIDEHDIDAQVLDINAYTSTSICNYCGKVVQQSFSYQLPLRTKLVWTSIEIQQLKGALKSIFKKVVFDFISLKMC